MKLKITTIALLMAIAFLISQSNAQETSSSSENLLSKSLESTAASFMVQLSPSGAVPGDTVELEIAVQVADGWHIYPLQKGEEIPAWLPTKVKFDATGLVPINATFACTELPVERKFGDEVQSQLSGKFSWKRKYRLDTNLKKFGGQGSITFQVCNDEKCLPPQTLEFALGSEPSVAELVDGEYEPIGEPVEIKLEACKLERPKAKLTLATLLFSSNPVDKLVLKGTFPFSPDKKFDIYLPRKRKYTVKNTSPNDGRIAGNTSTFVSIDQDGDGSITRHETYASSLPIRIEDKMFKIVGMDKETKSLKIQQIDTPLFGTIVGKSIPPFEYTTVDGKTISNKSILGKVTILDIWAVT